jgi:type IV pilus assembly protein PilF
MRRISFLLLPFALGGILLAGCDSSPSRPTPAQPVVPNQPPLPPPIQEAPAPYRAQLHAEIAAGFFERGQMEVALQELAEAVKLDPRNPKIYNVYGLVYTVMGQDAEAQANFLKGLELAPNDSEIRQNWGWYLCTHGRPKESIAEFEMAVRNPLYRTPDVSLANAGKCAAASGDPVRAAEFYKRALAIAPNNMVAGYNLSLLAYRERNFADARTYMRRVMQQTNPPPEALYLGMCIERKLGDAQSEASYVSQLRNRYPQSAEALAIPAGVCE